MESAIAMGDAQVVLNGLIDRMVSRCEVNAVKSMVAGVKPIKAMHLHGLFYHSKSKDYRRVKQSAGL